MPVLNLRSIGNQIVHAKNQANYVESLKKSVGNSASDAQMEPTKRLLALSTLEEQNSLST